MGRADPAARVEELTKRLEAYRAEAQELQEKVEASEEADDEERLELLRESLIPDCEQELEYWRGRI